MKTSFAIALSALIGMAFAENLPTNLSLRSNAYGTVLQGITASDDGISDLNTRPYLAGGKQLIGIEAGNNSTASAAIIVKALGGNTFGQFQAHDTIGSITRAQFGWSDAAGSMGFSLFIGDNTIWSQSEIGGKVTGTRTNRQGHQFGIGGGAKVSAYELFGTFRWITNDDETKNYVDDDLNAYDLDHTWAVMAGARNINGPAIWDARYTFSADVQDQKAGTTTKRSIPSHFLNLEIGQPIPTQVQGLKPFVGLLAFGNLTDPTKGYYYSVGAGIKFGLEYALFEHWNVMGGYTFTDYYFRNVNDAATEEFGSLRLTPSSRGALGVTYHKDAFSVETKLMPQVSDDGPAAFFSGSNILASTAAIWNF